MELRGLSIRIKDGTGTSPVGPEKVIAMYSVESDIAEINRCVKGRHAFAGVVAVAIKEGLTWRTSPGLESDMIARG